MALFTISDPHLSLSTDKPMTVFRGWDNYVERLEKNWRAIVTDDDTVVIPGDISWAMKLEDALEDFRFLHNLPGKKLILKGNHDLWWTTMNKMRSFIQANGLDTIDFINNSAVKVGDVAVCGTRGWLIEESGTDSKLIKREALRLAASLEAGKGLADELVVFLHYPPITSQSRCDEIIEVLNKFSVKRVYYGHIHAYQEGYAVNGEVDGITYRLVSCNRVDFTPILVR